MFQLYGRDIHSRLLMGSSGFASPQQLMTAVSAAKTEIVTLSLKRELPGATQGTELHQVLQKNITCLLPNTAGCRTAKEAIQTAVLARELFSTPWIKLEVTCDDFSLHPHSVALIEATKELVGQGFQIFPYCSADMSVCEALIEAGVEVLMPWGSPIGSGQGLQNLPALRRLRERFLQATLIVDAGIGGAADACLAMESGADAVLVNSAISRANDPVLMAASIAQAVEAGRKAREAGRMPKSDMAIATTLVPDRPIWHSE